MSEMLTKIKKKINSQNLLNQQIKEIEFILYNTPKCQDNFF